MRKWSKEYTAWANMKKRVLSQAPSYRRIYAGSRYDGMEIEPSWIGEKGFAQFLADVGMAPSPKHYLDRKNNEKGYIKDNVRWATIPESNANKRGARPLTAFGKTQNMMDWVKETGLSYAMIRHRLNRGWSIEKALSTPRRTWK